MRRSIIGRGLRGGGKNREIRAGRKGRELLRSSVMLLAVAVPVLQVMESQVL